MLLDTLEYAYERLLDLLYPRRCLSCHQVLSPTHIQGFRQEMCAPCSDGLLPVTAPMCVQCGVPFPTEPTDILRRCGPCGQIPCSFDRATAGFVYGETIKQAILRFKRTGLPRDAAMLIQLCQFHGSLPTQVTHFDSIVPVPLHKNRAAQRGFNQAAVLARALARVLGTPCTPGALIRKTDTPLLSSLSLAKRKSAAQGAFLARRKAVEGLHILLVDDVMTTGGTAQACSKTMKRNGAQSVHVWTLARVVRNL